MWAQIMRDRFGATDEKRADDPLPHPDRRRHAARPSSPRTTSSASRCRASPRSCGGTQSLHTNGFDEALALPTERSAKIALRTQQVLAHESGAADTVDPFAGSYFVEALTDEIEERAWELIEKVEELGGSVERARVHPEARSRSRRSPTRSATGPARTSSSASTSTSPTRSTTSTSSGSTPSPSSASSSAWKLKAEPRPGEPCDGGSRSCASAARGDGNLLPPIKEALRDRASIGEVCGAMRDVFGEYRGRRRSSRRAGSDLRRT